MAELTESKLEKIAARAAKKVQAENFLRDKALSDPDTEILAPKDEQDFQGIDDTPPEDGDEAAAFDLFEYVGEKFPNQAIQYVLRRNGEMLGVVHHPFSWAQIQKRYKGGQYQVTARNITTKRYIKSETRAVADPETTDDQDSGRVTMEQVQATILNATKAAQAAQPQAPSFIEMMTIMNQMNAKQKEAEREASQAAATSSAQIMQTFMQMSQNQAQATQAMMLEIAKMTQTMSEKMSLTTQTMFEKMESRFEKIVDKLTNQPKKDDGIGMLELLKLQQDSQDKGFKFATQLTQIAEAKAQEKVELIEEMEERFGGKGGNEKKSMTDTLIETMLPTISNALLQQKTGAAQAAPQIPHQQRRSLPNRAANPGGKRVARQNTALARTGTNANQNQTGGQGQAQATTQTGAVGGAAGRTNPQPSEIVSPVANKFGLGSIAIEPEQISTEIMVSSEHSEEDHIDQDFIVAELAPVIGESLMNGVEPKEAANSCIEKLKTHNISVKKLLELLSHDDMMKLVATYNLPPEANPWFNEVYESFKASEGA